MISTPPRTLLARFPSSFFPPSVADEHARTRLLEMTPLLGPRNGGRSLWPIKTMRQRGLDRTRTLFQIGGAWFLMGPCSLFSQVRLGAILGGALESSPGVFSLAIVPFGPWFFFSFPSGGQS